MARRSFSDVAKRYLDEDIAHLAPTTQRDRRSIVDHLQGWFGKAPIQSVSRADLRAWWASEIEGHDPPRSVSTGKNYLDALAGIFGFAAEMEWIEESPIPAFRETLRRRLRTKAGRAQSQPGRHVHPFEADELARLLGQELGEDRLLTLALLDAGLRLGEALGLEWPDVAWGRSADVGRHLCVRRSLSRGLACTTPKSGRERRVGLSRRLRSALRQEWVKMGQPARGRIFRQDQTRYRRHFQAACAAAELGHRLPKDLRDTYASQLLTMGIQLAYISAQLGHADVGITARHYARWCGGEGGWVETVAVGPGELPADLLERITALRLDSDLRRPA